jgi:cytochrome c nitrite reductase small subunit
MSPAMKKKPNWLKISLITNIVLVAVAVIGLSGMAVIHQSDTNPEFCATCHLMQSRVDSYLTSTNLDHVHAQAGVQCKECHDYSIPDEIESGIKYITGNYNPDLPRRKFGDEMCLQCHISMDYMATQTDYLVRNPHLNHWPDMRCTICHVSHGEQVDYCSDCHDNGGQRMTGGAIIPRAENPWAPSE